MYRLIAVAIAALVIGSGVAIADSGASAASNRAAARADAVKLLGEVSLPAGATKSATEPAGGGRELARPFSYPATPNLVDRHQWWVVPGSLDSLFSYIHAHRPQGSSWAGGGTAHISPRRSRAVFYSWPAVENVLSLRWLVITAVSLGNGTTGVRVDAEDVWITPRPASEQIPSSAARLRLTVTQFGRRIQGPRVFVSQRKLQSVISLMNSLPATQPGARSCPSDWGTIVTLAFIGSGGGGPQAVAGVDPAGCEGVSLTLDGKPQPGLASWPIPGHPHANLVQLLEHDLGVGFKGLTPTR